MFIYLLYILFINYKMTCLFCNFFGDPKIAIFTFNINIRHQEIPKKQFSSFYLFVSVL